MSRVHQIQHGETGHASDVTSFDRQPPSPTKSRPVSGAVQASTQCVRHHEETPSKDAARGRTRIRSDKSFGRSYLGNDVLQALSECFCCTTQFEWKLHDSLHPHALFSRIAEAPTRAPEKAPLTLSSAMMWTERNADQRCDVGAQCAVARQDTTAAAGYLLHIHANAETRTPLSHFTLTYFHCHITAATGSCEIKSRAPSHIQSTEPACATAQASSQSKDESSCKVSTGATDPMMANGLKWSCHVRTTRYRRTRAHEECKPHHTSLLSSDNLSVCIPAYHFARTQHENMPRLNSVWLGRTS